GTRKNVLIVGLNPLCDLFLDWAAEQGREKIEVVGILSDAERHRGRLLRSRKILGTPEQVEQSLHDFSVHGVVVDTIVVASPTKDLTEKARDALRAIETAGGVRIDYLSARYAFDEMQTHCANDGNRRYSAVTVSSPPHLDAADLPSASYLRWKRAVDAAGALVCLVCFAPVMAVVFVLVRIDVGAPAIFWQQRPGARGKPIRVLKFRTMGPARNPEGRPLSDIERVSGVGRLLRRLRLDELPQVYNVLAGHMSFVGPRPLLPIDQPSAPLARLRIRPGLTGWAQIKGGRRLSIEDKAALDLWYIKNASLSLDLLILAETVRMILFGDRVDSRAVDAAWKDLHADEAASFSADMARSTSA
ncbi:MAG: sugar transferase, partial [Hyphomicrobium sp.]